MWSVISRSLPLFAQARRHQSQRRFTLERLEERALLSTITLTVNTLADDPGGPLSGQTTLCDAITTADAGTGNKYVIKFAVDGTIDLLTPLPDLSNDIAIKGPGAANLTILPHPNDAIYIIFMVDSGETVDMYGITISGGYNFNHIGAGIFSYGTLTINNDVFTNNAGGSGSAIENEAGMLTVTDSSFVNNATNPNEGGGAINSSGGSLAVNDSSFTNNTGGGIISNSNATITNSRASLTKPLLQQGLSACSSRSNHNCDVS